MSVVCIKPMPILTTAGNLQKITINCKDEDERNKKDKLDLNPMKFSESKLNSFRKTRKKFLNNMNKDEKPTKLDLRNKPIAPSKPTKLIIDAQNTNNNPTNLVNINIKDKENINNKNGNMNNKDINPQISPDISPEKTGCTTDGQKEIPKNTLGNKKLKINTKAVRFGPLKDIKGQTLVDDFSKGFLRKSTYQQMQNINKIKTKEEMNPVNKDLKKTKTIQRHNNYLFNFNDKDLPPLLSPLTGEYSGFHKAMHSLKPTGKIYSYGVNCYKGIFRDYNEDRVCIFFNIGKPKDCLTNWPSTLSIFCIFDGHGGKKCAEFLRDNLHIYLIHSKYFPRDIENAIMDAFQNMDDDFLNKEGLNEDKSLNDNSGSCANVCIIAEDTCYIANVGDSRAFLSKKKGKELKQLSFEHKPNIKEELKRIKKNGGQVYKSSLNTNIYRILPGNLAVSRAFGNASTKLAHLGGKKDTVICTPDITKISLKDEEENDYIFMGCDGIFDRMTNEDINKAIWETLKSDATFTSNIHIQSSLCVDLILKTVMSRSGTDNLTAILIGLKGFNDSFLVRKYSHM